MKRATPMSVDIINPSTESISKTNLIDGVWWTNTIQIIEVQYK